MSILNIDDEAKIVDVLFKFAANEKILLHKHTAAFNTFVVKGEHRIYTPEGELPKFALQVPIRQASLMRNLTPKAAETKTLSYSSV